MMAETVVYSREFLFIKDLYEKGELGKIQYIGRVATRRTWTAGPNTGSA